MRMEHERYFHTHFQEDRSHLEILERRGQQVYVAVREDTTAPTSKK